MDDVIIKLSPEKWNQVLALLAEGPFRIVAPLITEIREQALTQTGAAPPAMAGNGRPTERVDVSDR